MLLRYSIFFYHVRKPRAITQNTQSVIQYRKDLTEARRKVHQQAKQYQNMIEDQYILKHAEQTKLKHFQNQCEFRKRICQDAFKLNQNIKKWKRQDQKRQNKLNKYLHEEDIKRINRERIKKIITYQSQNYWYNADNVQQRLTEEVIFPTYIASTEYYHKLHMQALAYECFDFKMLNKVTSTQEVVKQKNKYLIPLFNEVKLKIRSYKTNTQEHLKHQHLLAIDKINLNQKLTQTQKQNLLKAQEQNYNADLNAYFDKLSNPVKRLNYTKQKLRTLVSLLGTWKQYTNILSMTSGQMLKTIEEAKQEHQIVSVKQNILKNIQTQKSSTFIDPIQEDTQQTQISLEQYLRELRRAQDIKMQAIQVKQTMNSLELNSLLKETQADMKKSNIDASKVQEKGKINVENLVKDLQNESFHDMNDIPLSFLNVEQTTSGVQIMKQLYKEDQQMIKLLNQIGEVSVEYPKLFKKIWDNTVTL